MKVSSISSTLASLVSHAILVNAGGYSYASKAVDSIASKYMAEMPVATSTMQAYATSAVSADKVDSVPPTVYSEMQKYDDDSSKDDSSKDDSYTPPESCATPPSNDKSADTSLPTQDSTKVDSVSVPTQDTSSKVDSASVPTQGSVANDTVPTQGKVDSASVPTQGSVDSTSVPTQGVPTQGSVGNDSSAPTQSGHGPSSSDTNSALLSTPASSGSLASSGYSSASLSSYPTNTGSTFMALELVTGAGIASLVAILLTN